MSSDSSRPVMTLTEIAKSDASPVARPLNGRDFTADLSTPNCVPSAVATGYKQLCSASLKRPARLGVSICSVVMR